MKGQVNDTRLRKIAYNAERRITQHNITATFGQPGIAVCKYLRENSCYIRRTLLCVRSNNLNAAITRLMARPYTE